MAIHPIEFRYGTPEMKAVWTEEAKLQKLLKVEAALAKAEAELGLISKSDAETIASCMDKVKGGEGQADRGRDKRHYREACLASCLVVLFLTTQRRPSTSHGSVATVHAAPWQRNGEARAAPPTRGSRTPQ